MRARRRALDGPHPRAGRPQGVAAGPGLATRSRSSCRGTGEQGQGLDHHRAFTRLLRNLIKDRSIGKRVVPIIPDEGRTFGLDALFPQAKIYAPFGQQYEPVDANLLLSYQEDRDGQILEEGITEAGSMASFTAAGTAYATWGEPMIPFFIFYSMFGFQRVGDLIWAFGDTRGRGFLLGATAGRTTLQGEGLQHADGHSPVLASTVPNCRVYDPAFAYELAVIVEDGMRRMYGDKPEDVFYYITLYNENYLDAGHARRRRGRHPPGALPLPPGPRRRTAPTGSAILASGTAMLAALEAQALLAEHHDVAAEVWSATSYKPLREDALATERWNRLHPTEVPRGPVHQPRPRRQRRSGPTVAVTDYMKAVPDQIARWVPQPVHPARHRRLRLLRHPERAAPPLRDRRRPHRGGGAVGAGPAGRREGRGGGGGDPALRARPRGDRPPGRLREGPGLPAVLLFLVGLLVAVDRPGVDLAAYSQSASCCSPRVRLAWQARADLLMGALLHLPRLAEPPGTSTSGHVYPLHALPTAYSLPGEQLKGRPDAHSGRSDRVDLGRTRYHFSVAEVRVQSVRPTLRSNEEGVRSWRLAL